MVVMSIDLAVWYMDGTLRDSTEVVPEAFVRATAAMNGPATKAADVVAAYWRGTPEAILSYQVGRELEAAEYEAYYRELDGVRASAYPGLVATLEALRAIGLPV